MRGFVLDGEYDENDEETMKSKIRREMVQKLAAEWNETHRKIEERSWRDEREMDDEADYLADRCADIVYETVEKAEAKNPSITKEELQEVKQKAEDAFYAEVDAKKRIDHQRLEVIEELISELGGRMARPYEHWNEDEKYMEYMETRHDNEDY